MRQSRKKKPHKNVDKIVYVLEIVLLCPEYRQVMNIYKRSRFWHHDQWANFLTKMDFDKFFETSKEEMKEMKEQAEKQK